MANVFSVSKSRAVTSQNGIEIRVPAGIIVPRNYVYVDTGDYLLAKCEAAWDTECDSGKPLDFRLVGPPGAGKNAAVYALAARRQQPLYMLQGHEELTAEDLVVSAAVGSQGQITYVASPVLAAMLDGGICFIDEIAKMRPRALAPLASVLDDRRTISSAMLGETFEAKDEFRFCAAYNPTDSDAFDLAPWLKRRILPEFHVSLPGAVELEDIIRRHCDNDLDDMGLWIEIYAYMRDKSMPDVMDAGTALRLLSYCRRLRAFNESDNPDAGMLEDVIGIAIEHVLPR